MKAIACWNKSDAEKILRTEALQGDAAVFAAIHTPLRSIQVSGPLAASLSETSERSVLSLLSATEREHALCVVRGHPGTGKSHLIRWLRAHWNVEGDEPFLVPRTDGSLTGTLRRLREQLGSEYESLFAGLADESRVALAGRANDFQSRIANSLREGYYEGTPPVHAEFCARNKVYDLIGSQRVLEKWSAPRRILQILSGSGADGEHSERDQESAKFFLKDIAELAHAAFAERALSPAAGLFRTPLHRESQKLQPLLEAGRPDAEIRKTLGDDAIPNSLKLVEALNARRNDAVRDLLGLGRHALKDLFRKLRIELKARSKRLVLMLEDVTSFEGVDDQLIEAVIQRADVEGNEDLCRLVAICGVTPDYYEEELSKLGNVVDRIDLHILLEGDGNVLATEDARRTFAGRYLRAIRAGVPALSTSAAPPNRCSQCVQQLECHRAFGVARVDEDDVGLYPFNARALNTLFEELEDAKSRGKLVQTPRGFLKAVLGPTLFEPQHIIDGAFPTAQVETTWHPERARHRLGPAGGVMGRALEARTEGVGVEDQQRVRRLVAWWGDWKVPRTAIVPECGDLAFGGVSKAVFDTFRLPWVGDESPAPGPGPGPGPSPGPDPGPSPGPDPGPRPGPAPGPSPGPDPGARPGPAPGPSPGAGPGPGPKKRFRASDADERSSQLGTWRDGGSLENDGFWNAQLARLVAALPWAELEIDPWTQQEFFTPELVTLDGTTGRRLTTYFFVPREDVIANGLEALASLDSDPETSPEPNWYSVAECMRRLGELAREHVRRLFQNEKAARWDFRPRLAQALLARAYIRGRTRPDAPLIDQWAVVLERGGEITDFGRERVDSWLAWEKETRLVSDLPNLFELALVAGSPDDKADRRSTLLDVSTVAAALLRFSRTLRFDDEGPAQELKGDKFVLIRKFLEWTKAATQIDKVARFERDRLRRMLDAIDAAAGRRSMSEHLEEARTVLNTATAQALDLVPHYAVEWQKLCTEIFGSAETPSLDPMWERVDREVEAMTADGAEGPRVDALAGPDALTWCLSRRADEISKAHGQLNRLDALIAKLTADLKSRVDTKLGGADDLEKQLSKVANTLTEALDRIDSLLEGEGE